MPVIPLSGRIRPWYRTYYLAGSNQNANGLHCIWVKQQTPGIFWDFILTELRNLWGCLSKRGCIIIFFCIPVVLAMLMYYNFKIMFCSQVLLCFLQKHLYHYICILKDCGCYTYNGYYLHFRFPYICTNWLCWISGTITLSIIRLLLPQR